MPALENMLFEMKFVDYMLVREKASYVKECMVQSY
jgi:hypothetical protein